MYVQILSCQYSANNVTLMMHITFDCIKYYKSSREDLNSAEDFLGYVKI